MSEEATLLPLPLREGAGERGVTPPTSARTATPPPPPSLKGRGLLALPGNILPHAVLILGVLLFALPIWMLLAGSTQESGRSHAAGCR